MKIKLFSKIGIGILLLFTATSFVMPQKQAITKKDKRNVLFIMIDDLRPELSIYGKSKISSPSIESLARTGVTFENAYCNVPVCGASRASLLTGKRPTSSRFLRYNASIKREAPSFPTIAKHFKNNGYTTISNNKIIHLKNDAPGSWDEEWYPYKKGWRNYISKVNIDLENDGEHGYPYESLDVEDIAYFDGQTAEKSISDLKKFKQDNKPFFLAVGFVKPHLPFNAPKKYWDLYDFKKIGLPENAVFPKSAPESARHNWGELRYYKDIPKKGPVPDSIAKKLIHGYYAAVSYVDAQVGKVIDAIDELGLRESTVIVLVGDHGWSLSEHGLWAKHSNFKVALQVPLIISAPGIPRNKRTKSVAELIDLYPTLCELTNNIKPTHLDGTSLVKPLENPLKIYNTSAWARYQRGETLIFGNYSYTEWQRNDNTFAKMLYDHSNDPNETINLADDTNYKSTVDHLSALLNQRIKKYKTLELKNN